MADPYNGLRLAPLGDLEAFLLDQVRWGFYTPANAKDVLVAREQLFFNLESGVIPAYRGFVGATVDGTLVYGDSEHAILAALDAANSSGRLGYFHWVEPQPS